VARGDQRPTADLPARVRAQLAIERLTPRVERVHHRARERDLLASGLGQRQGIEPVAPRVRHQPTPLRAAVVLEHRLDPLLPFGALLAEPVAQPDQGAQIEEVIGRDPRLRQPPGQPQLAVVARVGAVGLGALLAPPPSRNTV
jgi:hypothetical protein